MVRSRYGIAVVVALVGLPAAADATPGTLDLRQSLDRSGGIYFEGSVSYVRVRGVRGKLVVRRRVRRPSFRMQRRLTPGRYRVISYQRPCDGNCGTLDPPTDRCARRARVLSGGLTEVAVRVRPGRRCGTTRNALPARFPPVRRLRSVRRWLRTRGGSNSWALVDSWRRMHSFAPHRGYVSASLVKVMLLVAYLRGIGNRAPDAGERASLAPMITTSSNDAADTVYHRVGDAGLYRLARLAGMRSFSVAGYWANARLTAGDQARFFSRIDRLVPKASRSYARALLSSIVRHQRWGFSRYSVAAGFKTFFKGGWRGTRAGQLVHEAALFKRGRTRISMAVLTDGNPSHDYGTETLRGVAQRIFRTRPGHASAEPAPENEVAKQAGSRAIRGAGSWRCTASHRASASVSRTERSTMRRARHEDARPLGGANRSGRILRNRLTLKNAMERFGFSAYLNGWWRSEHHFRPSRYLDVTFGC